MIVGNNSLLNQYVPTFYIKDLLDGQMLKYDSTKRAFVNVPAQGGNTGATRLGQLDDVSNNVDNPLSLQNGQALVYNSFTSLWENKFIDYNTLLNAPNIPVNSSFSFVGLSDTASPSLPGGYVKWNSAGTQLVYSATIPAASITGLALVATTGDYNDLINKPPSGAGSVTTVSVVNSNGVSGTVANPTTTPAITLSLGNITPISVAATGTVTGSNISGTNTGDQTISLSGDVSGSGTGSFVTTLSTVNATIGTFGSGTVIPRITVDAKGRITNVVTVPISESGLGTVTSVSATGTQGVTALVTNGTSTPLITVGLGAITPTSVAANGTVTGSNLSGTNTGDQTITLTGNVTGSGTGSFVTTIADNAVTNARLNDMPNATLKGRVTAGAGDPEDLTSTQATTLINTFTSVLKGLAPASGGGTNNYLRADGTWAAPAGATSGTVTSVSVATANGVSGTVTNPTTTPQINLTLGAITPTSVAATGNITGANLSGTNTGDQTITLTGDVTGSGTGSFITTLANTSVVASTYGSATQIPVFTVDTKGRITGVTNTEISSVTAPVNQLIFGTGSGVTSDPGLVFDPVDDTLTVGTVGSALIESLAGQSITLSGDTSLILTTNSVNRLVISSSGAFSIDGTSGSPGQVLTSSGAGSSPTWTSVSGVGSVTSVSVTTENGISGTVVNSTTTPEIILSLGDITPTSVAATGSVTGSNLSGTNTGDQTITLTGDVSGSGTGSFAVTLSETVNLAPGVYGTDHLVPTITVNNKGLVTSITTQHVDTSVRDLVESADTLVVAPRHQYIVTGVLEVDGYIVNNGVIAIL